MPRLECQVDLTRPSTKPSTASLAQDTRKDGLLETGSRADISVGTSCVPPNCDIATLYLRRKNAFSAGYVPASLDPLYSLDYASIDWLVSKQSTYRDIPTTPGLVVLFSGQIVYQCVNHQKDP